MLNFHSYVSLTEGKWWIFQQTMFHQWAMSFITWQVDANLQEVQNRISDSAARTGGYTHWVCLEIGENWEYP